MALSFVHWNSVPSFQMRKGIMASLRATATLAFFAPTRFIRRTPHALTGDHRWALVSNAPAAS